MLIRPGALRLLVRAAALRLFIGPGAGLRLLLIVRIAVVLIVAVHVGVHPVVATVVVIAIIVAALAPLLLIGARAAIAQHAEVMIGKLQIIFGLDTIPGKLRIARHALIFLEQLRGIATLAVVLPITAIVAARHAPGLLSTATATAAGLTIIDQAKFPRRTGACRA